MGVVRAVVKLSTKALVSMVYSLLGFAHYSYKDYCQVEPHPTKRYTDRMRFRPFTQKVGYLNKFEAAKNFLAQFADLKSL